MGCGPSAKIEDVNHHDPIISSPRPVIPAAPSQAIPKVENLLNCRTLKDYLTVIGNPGLDEKDIKRFISQIVKQLSDMHANNTNHLQLNSNNLLLNNEKTGVIISTGANTQINASKNQVVNQQQFENDFYFSPEILKKECNDFKPSDIWAIGILILELCFGTIPLQLDDIYNINTQFIFDMFKDKKYTNSLILFTSKCLNPNQYQRITVNGLLEDLFLIDRGLTMTETLEFLFQVPKYHSIIDSELTLKLKDSSQNEGILKYNVESVMNDELSSDLFLEGLQILTHLKKLHLQDSKLGPNGIDKIFKRLKNMEILTDINISNNLLLKEGMTIFSTYVKYLTNLEILNLNVNSITDEGTNILFEEIKKITTIKELRMNHNGLTQQSCTSLSTSFLQLTNITVLELSKNKINSDGLSILSTTFQYITKLESFDISVNEIDLHGIKFMTEHLKYLPNLRYLDLHSNNIGNEGIKFLFCSFNLITNLSRLNISDTKIDSKSLDDFSKNLCYIPNLNYLNLKDNSLISEGISTIAKHFSLITNLNVLDLTNTQIDDVGFMSLESMIKDLSYLSELHMSQNNITVNYREILRDAVHIHFLK